MFAEGEIPYDEKDFRFTYRDGILYAFQMKPSKEVKIMSLHNDRCGTWVEKVEVLGDNTVASFKNGDEGLCISLEKEPADIMPLCFKITLA